ncbi:DUF4031 domain-containing protein [Kitasatospora sp. NPDC088134]|uniref:DUF4031 domain-containing protein n=1 Tax=Kitasatospora sp. NPDC088134 TaxID=3364071 RepID=UPI00381AFB2D
MPRRRTTRTRWASSPSWGRTRTGCAGSAGWSWRPSAGWRDPDRPTLLARHRAGGALDWPGYGKWWSHLVSDVSLAELHAFAAELGAPAKGFERDLPQPSAGGTPFDIPAHWYEKALALGATPVASRELVARLTAAGLRVRKHGG